MRTLGLATRKGGGNQGSQVCLFWDHQMDNPEMVYRSYVRSAAMDAPSGGVVHPCLLIVVAAVYETSTCGRNMLGRKRNVTTCPCGKKGGAFGNNLY